METKLKTRRSIKAALVLSVALNLLFVGLVAGAFWRGGGGEGPHGGHRAQSYGTPYIKALPQEERRALQRAIRSQNPAMGRKARREGYAAMLGALRAEPFDTAAAQDVLETQGKAIIGIAQSAQAQWLNAVQGMSVEERGAYADRLEEVLKRGPRKGRKKRTSGD